MVPYPGLVRRRPLFKECQYLIFLTNTFCGNQFDGTLYKYILKLCSRYERRSSHRGEIEDSGLLGCDAVQLAKCFPTFRENVSVVSPAESVCDLLLSCLLIR